MKSDEKTVGTRHLLVMPREEGGLRLEEHLEFVAQGRIPGARVDRIEDVGPDWRPVALDYMERGESGGDFRGQPYETFRAGPVEGGVWKAVVRIGGAATSMEERRRG